MPRDGLQIAKSLYCGLLVPRNVLLNEVEWGPLDHARSAKSAYEGCRGSGLEENGAGFDLELAQANVIYPVGPSMGTCSYCRRKKRKKRHGGNIG